MENLPDLNQGTARDQAGKAIGVSGRTVDSPQESTGPVSAGFFHIRLRGLTSGAIRGQHPMIDTWTESGRQRGTEGFTESQALKRRKEIYETLHPETRQHRAGGHGAHRASRRGVKVGKGK